MSHSNPTQVPNEYLGALSRVFSPLVMESLVLTRRSDYLAEVCSNAGLRDPSQVGATVSDFFCFVYAQLLSNYRCEYVYKNEIASKILLGRHSLNTAQMLTEVRIGSSKADVVVINGTSTVYEIKSEFDSFARLEGQLHSYSKVFEHINVITSPRQADSVAEMTPASVGVLVLTDRCTIATVRPAESNIERIELDALFEILRKAEYLRLIRSHYGDVPEVPNTRIHSICKRMFCEIPVREAHSLAMKQLGGRFCAENLKSHIDAIPAPLRAYALHISQDLRGVKALTSILSQPVQSVLP